MARRLNSSRLRDARGFTLIELLIVILIIGILAAIALPAFLNQRTKAQDVAAKSAVRNARTALETYHTETQTYNTNAATLQEVEPALLDARDLAVSGTDTTFTVSVDSVALDGGGTFTIALDAAGNAVRTCSNPGQGGCRATADSQGNLW